MAFGFVCSLLFFSESAGSARPGYGAGFTYYLPTHYIIQNIHDFDV